ncbi:MAG: triacylglycerol lipase [Solirubrobacteraceae bacterium]|nr:triacylglycerol lipase [Solirubrobacteraceae bacterium]
MTEILDGAGLDPAAPAAAPPPPEPRRWWGRHVAEVRWQAELARLLMDPVFRGEGVPRGTGGPVLLIPGFLAGDSSLAVMQGWLGRIGYDPYASGIVCNVDCSDRALDRLDARLRDIHERTGRRTALVGHSRGAHFAKALAHKRPDWVAGMVSLGAGLDTPFDISVPTKAAVAAVGAVHRGVRPARRSAGCLTDRCGCPFSEHYAGTFPTELPLTSIYSREDGVVWWEACVVGYARNVEVTGSHVGLAFNRKAYRALADALAAMDG